MSCIQDERNERNERQLQSIIWRYPWRFLADFCWLGCYGSFRRGRRVSVLTKMLTHRKRAMGMIGRSTDQQCFLDTLCTVGVISYKLTTVYSHSPTNSQCQHHDGVYLNTNRATCSCPLDVSELALYTRNPDVSCSKSKAIDHLPLSCLLECGLKFRNIEGLWEHCINSCHEALHCSIPGCVEPWSFDTLEQPVERLIWELFTTKLDSHVTNVGNYVTIRHHSTGLVVITDILHTPAIILVAQAQPEGSLTWIGIKHAIRAMFPAILVLIVPRKCSPLLKQVSYTIYWSSKILWQ